MVRPREEMREVRVDDEVMGRWVEGYSPRSISTTSMASSPINSIKKPTSKSQPSLEEEEMREMRQQRTELRVDGRNLEVGSF